VKKPLDEQKHFTQRRKVVEGAEKTKQLFFASLCALASLREISIFSQLLWDVGSELSSIARTSPLLSATFWFRPELPRNP
jgi:hypothetical protein